MLNLTLSNAISGYTLFAEARRLSPKTLADYHNTFAKFGLFVGTHPRRVFRTGAEAKKFLTASTPLHRTAGRRLPDVYRLAIQHQLIADPLLADLTAADIRQFLAAPIHKNLRPKTLKNYHAGLSALWSWAVEETLAPENIAASTPSPKALPPEIIPYTTDEIERLLKACAHSAVYTRPGKRATTHTPLTVNRNRAIIMTLLDTGLRSAELCDLKMRDLDLRTRQLIIREGKGGKMRVVYFSPRTGKTLWRYLAERNTADPDPIFATTTGGPLNPDSLNSLITRLLKKAQVRGNVHKFRHTFALTCVNSGMNALVLQRLLGHSSLDMVRRYVNAASVDLAAGYRSPVESMRL